MKPKCIYNVQNPRYLKNTDLQSLVIEIQIAVDEYQDSNKIDAHTLIVTCVVEAGDANMLTIIISLNKGGKKRKVKSRLFSYDNKDLNLITFATNRKEVSTGLIEDWVKKVFEALKFPET